MGNNAKGKKPIVKYRPSGFNVWDGWCMACGDTVHLYHLQTVRPEMADSQNAKAGEVMLGHASSQDLLRWQEHSSAFGPDPENDNDDLQPWTGCCLWHGNRGYMYYTMRGSSSNARIQGIGMATCESPEQWLRTGDCPVIVPDSRWYATTDSPVPGVLDCRDLVVIQDPEREGWWGFYATRLAEGSLPESSAIACVWSADLKNWEHRPPAFVPGNISCIEVPDVFPLNGRWYMTCLTGHVYSNRGFWSDPNVNMGTLYAVADRVEGPYHMLEDNVLLGSCEMDHISCRSVMFGGKRYALYTDMLRVENRDGAGPMNGTITTPKLLRTSGDQLELAYCDLIESCIDQTLIKPGCLPAADQTEEMLMPTWPVSLTNWQRHDAGVIEANASKGWGSLAFAHKADSSIFELGIDFKDAIAAGAVIRIKDYHNRLGIILNRDTQTLDCVTLPVFKLLQRRQLPGTMFDQSIHMRLVNRLETLEVYLNDKLYLAFPRFADIGGRVGLFADRGGVAFSDISLRSLSIEPA